MSSNIPINPTNSVNISTKGVPHKLSDKLLTFEQQKEKRDLANAKRRQAYANKQRE
ncbi:hypothetical protein GIB67_007110, partial [Kingdonia uniflora]